MRVFSEIHKYQLRKYEAPLLGLAKSIYPLQAKEMLVI